MSHYKTVKLDCITGVGIQASKDLVCPAVIILDFESRGELGMVQSSINR